MASFTRLVVTQARCRVVTESFAGEMLMSNVLEGSKRMSSLIFASASNSCTRVGVLAQDEGGAKGYLLHGSRLS